MRKAIFSLCLISQIAILPACAPSADKISPAYISPLQYQHFSCNQIRSEMIRVSRRVNEVAGVQDSQASKDSVALGVGLVLFWPALFFMIGKDKEEELARLKGEYEALEQGAIQKDCDVAAEIQAAREMSEKRQAAKKEQQKPTGKSNE